ncbi:hypothetical protein H1O16_gp196 [Burkholderia phage BcepSaruman]|uniref:Uncharacterized protein n=1 Tax=Burkholderia phage BcepSaruman TaxID=2530032 RepID=A0A4D5ZD34_9CAUD|nr:hypothetical protein H1O16_gp196 [Burkholderia phage BcepSaruman]QBX06609.1 hypothetical protein BcepSaruman_196 [Burkholderia phage BcepSaruman]
MRKPKLKVPVFVDRENRVLTIDSRVKTYLRPLSKGISQKGTVVAIGRFISIKIDGAREVREYTVEEAAEKLILTGMKKKEVRYSDEVYREEKAKVGIEINSSGISVFVYHSHSMMTINIESEDMGRALDGVRGRAEARVRTYSAVSE